MSPDTELRNLLLNYIATAITTLCVHWSFKPSCLQQKCCDQDLNLGFTTTMQSTYPHLLSQHMVNTISNIMLK